MSIADLREAMNDTGGKLTMRYEDGGKVQVFMMGDIEVRLGPTASQAEIKSELAKEMAKKKNAVPDAASVPVVDPGPANG